MSNSDTEIFASIVTERLTNCSQSVKNDVSGRSFAGLALGCNYNYDCSEFIHSFILYYASTQSKHTIKRYSTKYKILE